MSYLSESVTWVINSRSRLNPNTSTSTNFKFSVNKNINRITKVNVASVQIPFTYYAINSSNNKLTFNGGIVSIQISPGNYNISSLILELTNKINTAFNDNTTSITYSNSTFKLTISRGTAFIVDSANDIAASTLASNLGFRVSSPSNLSATSDSSINLSGPKYITIDSIYLTRLLNTRMIYSDDSLSDTLAVVPVDVSPGDTITTSKVTNTVMLGKKTKILSTDIIDISIKDEYRNILDLNGNDISIQIVFYIE